MEILKKKILIVDDEADILELIKFNLDKEDYLTYTANNGLEALEIAKKQIPDLIIFDIMMPKLDGMETCRQLRTYPELKNTIIVFLTARTEEYSEVSGFDVGADDYIPKPIKPRALISRIQALLRRGTSVEAENKSSTLSLGELVIDRESYLVYVGEEKHSLAKKEFELLYLLASKPGKVFTREAILNSVWEDSVIVTNRTIDVHIRKIREKIGDAYISTVKGVGYKFELIS